MKPIYEVTTEYAAEVSYEGEYKDGMKHGWGKIVLADGLRYEGQFENDQFWGVGTFFYPDGSTYHGEVEGLRHGGGFGQRAGRAVGQQIVVFGRGGRAEHQRAVGILRKL